jgi:hypothetical protein
VIWMSIPCPANSSIIFRRTPPYAAPRLNIWIRGNKIPVTPSQDKLTQPLDTGISQKQSKLMRCEIENDHLRWNCINTSQHQTYINNKETASISAGLIHWIRTTNLDVGVFSIVGGAGGWYWIPQKSSTMNMTVVGSNPGSGRHMCVGLSAWDEPSGPLVVLLLPCKILRCVFCCGFIYFVGFGVSLLASVLLVCCLYWHRCRGHQPLPEASDSKHKRSRYNIALGHQAKITVCLVNRKHPLRVVISLSIDLSTSVIGPCILIALKVTGEGE